MDELRQKVYSNPEFIVPGASLDLSTPYWLETTSTFRQKIATVHPEGERFLMVFPADADDERQQINTVLNWFEELKQRVPLP